MDCAPASVPLRVLLRKGQPPPQIAILANQDTRTIFRAPPPHVTHCHSENKSKSKTQSSGLGDGWICVPCCFTGFRVSWTLEHLKAITNRSQSRTQQEFLVWTRVGGKYQNPSKQRSRALLVSETEEGRPNPPRTKVGSLAFDPASSGLRLNRPAGLSPALTDHESGNFPSWVWVGVSWIHGNPQKKTLLRRCEALGFISTCANKIAVSGRVVSAGMTLAAITCGFRCHVRASARLPYFSQMRHGQEAN